MLSLLTTAFAYVLDGSRVSRRFDGHGGLSAGASSRLLFDYDESVRSDILDYLYKPNFGAALSICKVEIGGDVQSTNGAEASHMHTSKDLDLTRGYEWWLMAEAKKRNPDIVTYALSWGTPGWVGSANASSEGSYFTDDNIAYQTAYLKGAKSAYNITINYMGIWNERPWGSAEYVVKLRESFDAAGFNTTAIVGSDGTRFAYDPKHISALATNKSFGEAERFQGGHYTCAHDAPATFWEIEPAQTFWVNEEFSTLGGDWSGGGCWGRSLLQNYVKLNATATISWATIWAVVDSWRYWGNGLMYAAEPWSGNYTVPPPIWTSAHVTQFAAPGWRYLGGEGVGLLPGGGSWTAMVPDPAAVGTATGATALSALGTRTVRGAARGDFTLVLEKLEGACLRCAVSATTTETAAFTLAGPLLEAKPEKLATWITNSTLSFARVADTLVAANGSFSVTVPRDTMITLTTTTGQAKGHAASCTERTDTMCTGVYKPFPFPYAEDYDGGVAGRFAKFHSDNAGAFELRADADGGGAQSNGAGGHLLQASPRYPKNTEWATNSDPITSLGATDWVNYRANISVMLIAATPPYAVGDERVPFPTAEGLLTDIVDDPVSTGVYGGICVRQMSQSNSAVCLLIGVGIVGLPSSATAGWVLQADTPSSGTGNRPTDRVVGTTLASGALVGLSLGAYHTLSLGAQGDVYTAVIDGVVVVHAQPFGIAAVNAPVGQVSLRSSYSYVQFDDLAIDGGAESATSNFANSLVVKHLVWPSAPAPGGPTAPAKILPGADGMYGCSFTMAKNATATALARFAVAPGAAGLSTQKHTLSLLDFDTHDALATATVDLSAAKGGDLNGYTWAILEKAVHLVAGRKYVVASSERAGGDSFYDGTVQLTAAHGAVAGVFSPWTNVSSLSPAGSIAEWHTITSPGTKECWDTRGGNRIDTYACVADGHNEGFNYSATTGLITVGPQSDHASERGLCVVAQRAAQPSSSFAPTSSDSKCDASDPMQVFTHGADGSLRLRSDSKSCLTSGPAGNNAGVTLAPCAAPIAAAQVWSFGSLPQPAPPVAPRREWGTCYGPLNVQL